MFLKTSEEQFKMPTQSTAAESQLLENNRQMDRGEI